jgi:hypothetical protein
MGRKVYPALKKLPIQIQPGGRIDFPQNILDTIVAKDGDYVNLSTALAGKIEVRKASPPSLIDKFEVKKLYPDAATVNEWYVDMANPAASPNFKNLPTITKQPDGSFQTNASQVRMEAWSPVDKKFLNVEITAYTKLVSGTPQYTLQQYSRGGHHFSDPAKACEGSAMKGGLLTNGDSTCRKEVNHPAYCNNRGTVKATTKPLLKRWVGYKTVIYNYLSGGKTFVHMENYIDDDVTDASGNLVIKNNWVKCAATDDTGGWSTDNPDFKADCPHLNKDVTTGYRTRDEILNMPGGTATQNLAAWRTDGSTNNWKYLSVREIFV